MAVLDEIRPVRAQQTGTQISSLDWDGIKVEVDDLPSLVRLDGGYLDLVKRCQEEAYSEEICRLQAGKWLQKSSSLLSLAPILGSDGLVRLGGCAGRAKLPYEVLHPPLLPAKHQFTATIVRAFHLSLKHVETDYQISFIRQHFWIPGGRELVKRIRRECEKCRRERAKPGEQIMADLHESRLEFGSPPFTRTACDLFGPIDVLLSRNRTAKRRGVLLTCLVTRAVYLEMVTTLSSDDFLLILRRFIGLYGQPRVFHTDNGTNFVGTERELFEDPEVFQFIRRKGMQWNFQPPRTPHFGGAHESLVWSAKRALYAALDEEKKFLRHPTEETLRTMLYEVAGLLNGRPLTAASEDPADLRPLTTADFLNRANTASPPHGTFDDAAGWTFEMEKADN
ncbi:uncharacterized protein LOC130689299 [Daphnia carinata]|uniref:uncharacterized protein LOC130689299 n=1 Tax=Daphnia carinata TaxID=120202 RepID=UPI00257E5DAB|nr:uncharacterized protein LOC130689299 [Daphnia carinata]